MTEFESVWDLWQAAARRLTGRNVRVRNQSPCFVGRDGQALREGFKAYVDINPALGDETWLYVFCHECAHVKIHWDVLPTGKAALPPASFDQRALDAIQYKYHPVQIALEGAADELAQTWLNYATGHYQAYGHDGVRTLYRKLYALSEFQE